MTEKNLCDLLLVACSDWIFFTHSNAVVVMALSRNAVLASGLVAFATAGLLFPVFLRYVLLLCSQFTIHLQLIQGCSEIQQLGFLVS